NRHGRNPGDWPYAGLCPAEDCSLVALGRFRTRVGSIVAQGTGPAGREGTRHQDQPRDGERQRSAAAHHRRHPVGRRSRPDHGVQQHHVYLRQQRRRSHRPRRGSRQARGRNLQVLPLVLQQRKIFMSMPWAVPGAMISYRKSWFIESGGPADGSFPKNWDEYRTLGKKLKAAGHPIGQTLGHTFGDAPTFTYPYMWSWGGKEVEQ